MKTVAATKRRADISGGQRGGLDIYGIQPVRAFVGIDLARENAPDATTLLKFRRLLETNDMTQRMFFAINATLTEKGLLMRSGAIMEATIINAPPSTKNTDGKRDGDMHQTKKGNQWSWHEGAHWRRCR